MWCFGLVFYPQLCFGSIKRASFELLLKLRIGGLFSAQQVLPVLVWMFFATILFLPDAYDVFGAVLVAYCLAVIVSVRPRILEEQDWVFVALLLCYPLLMLPSAFVMGADYSFFDYPVRFLLFIPIVMGLRTKSDPQLVARGFFLGGSVGGLGAACLSVYSLLLHPGVRVGDPITNPIPFGQIAATLSLIAFSSIFYCSRRWDKVLSILGFLGGIVALCASASFGAILGLVIGLLVALGFVSKKLLSRSVWIGILLLLVASFCILSPLLFFRLHQLLAEVNAFASGAGMGTSLGQRLILWGISIREVFHSPWFGIGPGHFKSVLLQFCREVQCTLQFSGFNHVHSQYFDSALNGGLIGLAGLLISFVSPALLFYRRIAVSIGPAQGASIAGLTVVVAAMGSMISQPLYAHNISVISYVFTISVCWYLSLSASRGMPD
jgi:O-antigen ligase